MFRILILVLFLTANIDRLYCQLLDSAGLSMLTAFTSIEEALKTPEDVLKLNLKKQKLKEIPPEVYQFPYLQVLNLSKNKIRYIPKEIGKLELLQDLNLGKNQIETLPAEIGELKHLRALRMGQNELIELPPEIGQLKELRFLDLWSNNLRELPEEISQLKKLRKIDMRVIQFNDVKQKYMQELIPWAKIHFSTSCNCD